VVAELVAARRSTPEPQLASPDQELLEGIAQREDGAFEELVAAYQDRLYGLAWRVTGSPEDAEEAVQDALVRAHRALYLSYTAARIRELALRAWLFTITLNAARNRRRGRRLSRSLDEQGADGRLRFEPISDGSGPLAAAENSELRLALEQAIAELPIRYRTAVVVRMVEGLTYDETAQVLCRPVGTVKSDVHRGLRLLRERLAPLLW
jgi:RNA polymerase sigma-70 factor (ECF subfamily)